MFLFLVGDDNEVNSIHNYLEIQKANKNNIHLEDLISRVFNCTNLKGIFTSIRKSIITELKVKKLNKILKSLNIYDGRLKVVKKESV